MLLERLLPHIFAPAYCGLASTLIGVAGAMIIDVALLLELAHDRAAALAAGNQPGERNSWLMRRCFLVKRPSNTPCTRSHNSTETSGSCWPW